MKREDIKVGHVYSRRWGRCPVIVASIRYQDNKGSAEVHYRKPDFWLTEHENLVNMHTFAREAKADVTADAEFMKEYRKGAAPCPESN